MPDPTLQKNPLGKKFPGGLIGHRFVPTEKPRAVTEKTQTPQIKLAGEVGFEPVTKMSLSNNDVYVRPVRNTHTRSVSADVLSPSGKIWIKGEKQIEISPNLHTQIKTKVENKVEKFLAPPTGSPNVKSQTYTNAADLHTPTIQPKPPAPQPAPSVNPQAEKAKAEALKRQLDEINKILFEQIKSKIATEINRQRGQVSKPTVAQTPPPQPTKFEPKLPYKNGEEKKLPVTISLPKPKVEESVTSVEYKTHINKLEKEIVHLNAEISTLDKTIQDLQREQAHDQTAVIEKKVEVDQRMLLAIAEWRLALNNLINSHTIALKYLKQKTDWLEDKIAATSTHSEKHEKLHRKPKSVEVELQPLTRGFVRPELTAKLKEQVSEEPVPVPPVMIQPNTVATPNTPQANLSAKLAVEKVETKPHEEGHSLTDVATKLSVEKVEQKPASPEQTNGNFGLNTDLNVTQIKQGPPTPNQAAPLNIGANVTVEQIKQGVPTNPTQTPLNLNANLNVTKITEDQDSKETKAPPVTIQANLVTKPVEEGAPIKPGVAVVREVQAPSFEAVKELVKKSIANEQPNLKPSEGEVEKLVQEALEKQKTQQQQEVKQEIKQALQEEKPSEEPSVSKEQVKQLVEEALKETKIEPKQTPVFVKEVPADSSVPPTGTPVAEVVVKPIEAPVPTFSQSEIEKMILEQAAKEEAAKDAAFQAKVDESHRKAEEEALKKAAEAKAKESQTVGAQAVAPGEQTIDEHQLKAGFDKVKINLTTVDNQALAKLDQNQRTQMLTKLQNLEKEVEVSRQLDEIKAVAERRRINKELEGLLKQTEAVPEQTTTPTTTQAPVANPVQKVEVLKQVEKEQKTPEDKARVIAEIKELERVEQAKKAAAASRPVVKAQPAYGKMLPNTPTIPNVINGIVKDNKGLLLSTVVIIVKDKNDEPVRALKTNKIGQFALSTPVPNGVYTLELEKEGYEFDIIEVESNGSIMSPIEIKAR